MKTVFFDVDSQLDFVCPSGALYVPGAEKRLGAVAALNRYAGAHGIPVVSTMDAHAENDPEFRQWPPHCIKGTLGQRKAGSTLLEQDSAGSQVIVEKETLDCFDSPCLWPLLERLAADRYVVYGFATEYCVRIAALGLLGTGKRVELVTDAVACVNEEDAERAVGEFTASGGILTTLAEVCR
jgi:nicotinamidase/pyrazinamidase